MTSTSLLTVQLNYLPSDVKNEEHMTSDRYLGLGPLKRKNEKRDLALYIAENRWPVKTGEMDGQGRSLEFQLQWF